MPTYMEDEEKIGSDEDLAQGEQDNKPKKPSDSELIKAYLEDREDIEKEKIKKE